MPSVTFLPVDTGALPPPPAPPPSRRGPTPGDPRPVDPKPDPAPNVPDEPPAVPKPEIGVPEAATRPAWLPEKFKTAEDLAKAYTELEGKLGKSKTTDPLAIPKAAEVVALDAAAMQTFTTEFETAGSLSEDSYAKLAKAGLNKDVVDTYIEGQRALAERQAQSVYEAVGGKDKFAELQSWASTNLSKDDLDAYNAAVATRDPNQIKLAARAVQALHREARGEAPVTRVRGQTAGGGLQPFQNRQQMTAAMRDPLYRTDPAFRDEVAQRLALSTFA